jgi:molybdate/tungstate transport system permease protein
MGPALENVSRTLGASPASTFLRVTLPLASGGIFTGCILTWARAISEAGSLMILAYHPFTISVYAYDLFIQYGLQESRPAAVLLVIVCLWGFLVLRWLHATAMKPLAADSRRIGQ